MEVLDTFAQGTLTADGQRALEVVLDLVKLGAAHVLEAAFVDLGPHRLEPINDALGVAVKLGQGRSQGGGEDGEREEGEREEGDFHDW